MAQVFSISRLEKPDLRISTWFYNGGLSTATSYINEYTDSSGIENTQELHQAIERDKLWIEQLPSQIVLDDWRLVHAGYDPNVDLDCQTDSELLHVRKPFHRATEPIDVSNHTFWSFNYHHIARVRQRKLGQCMVFASKITGW